MTDIKYKVGLIGVGNWGKKLLKEIRKQAEIVKIAHKGSLETVEYLKTNYPQIIQASEVEDLLNDPSIEAIFVATPIDTLFDIGSKVLESKKHLFIEKPGGSNIEDLEKLKEKSNQSNLILCVGYEFTHHPALEKIKEVIGNSKIKSINMEWCKWGSFSESSIKNLLPHEVSILLSLTENNLEIETINKIDIVSNSDIINTKLTSGTIQINSLINRVSPNKYKNITISSDEKDIVWNNDDLFEINKEKNELVKIEIENTTSVSNEIKDFLESIKNKKKPKSDIELAIKIFKVIKKT